MEDLQSQIIKISKNIQMSDISLRDLILRNCTNEILDKIYKEMKTLEIIEVLSIYYHAKSVAYIKSTNRYEILITNNIKDEYKIINVEIVDKKEAIKNQLNLIQKIENKYKLLEEIIFNNPDKIGLYKKISNNIYCKEL